MVYILPDKLKNVLIKSFAVCAWQSNCYVLAKNTGSECIIIDPGPGAAAQLPSVIAENELTIKAVMVTHGHIDHVGDAALIANTHQVPLWIHPDDAHLLEDPATGLGKHGQAILTQLGVPTELPKPLDLQHFISGQTVSVAGLDIVPVAAPGHTPGCVLLNVAAQDLDADPVCFSGDVLFAGSIGRTDLPGGNPLQMQETLSQVVSSMDPNTVVLPGHGGQTTISQELAYNPYLRGL